MLFDQHQDLLKKITQAVQERTYFSYFRENPYDYGQEAMDTAKIAFENRLEQAFENLVQTSTSFQEKGEEKSPFWNKALDITYPLFDVEPLITNAQTAFKQWRKTDLNTRTGLLLETLIQLQDHFLELANATQHTTGQPYVLAYQMSGADAAHRALEVIAIAYTELTRFPYQVQWNKPMGRSHLSIAKSFHAIPKGIGLVIGNSVSPVFNTLPAIFANLMTGNVVLVKPHPKAVLPIAIVVARLQQLLQQHGFSGLEVQLATDTTAQPITKALAAHQQVQLIDYTGKRVFSNYLKTLQNKVIFSANESTNAVLIDSAYDLRAIMRNLAFSASLYAGQSSLSPQNFFIPESGIPTNDGLVPYKQVVGLLKNEISSFALHPQLSGALGGIANEQTIAQIKATISDKRQLLPHPKTAPTPYPDAQIAAPTVIELTPTDWAVYKKEHFGPLLCVIKTKDTDESLVLAQKIAKEEGMLNCLAYCTDTAKIDTIIHSMNEVHTPVALNFVGAALSNQLAGFSDFQGNAHTLSGDACCIDATYINRRFVWLNNRVFG